jgi:predicted HTH transcriptional regulator
MNVMAAHRIPARKIQAIFRFLQQGVINYRKQAKELSITRNTLKKYVASIQRFQVEYPDKKEDSDFYLKQLQQGHRGRNTDHFLRDKFISAAHAIIEGGTRKAEYQAINNVGRTVATEDLQDLVHAKVLENVGTTGRSAKYVLGRSEN